MTPRVLSDLCLHTHAVVCCSCFTLDSSLSLLYSFTILLLLLLSHLDYLYTRCLWADLHIPPVIPGTYVTSIRERHSSSFRFLLLLCLWIKVSDIWLGSQPPKTDLYLPYFVSSIQSLVIVIWWCCRPSIDIELVLWTIMSMPQVIHFDLLKITTIFPQS